MENVEKCKFPPSDYRKKKKKIKNSRLRVKSICEETSVVSFCAFFLFSLLPPCPCECTSKCFMDKRCPSCALKTVSAAPLSRRSRDCEWPWRLAAPWCVFLWENTTDGTAHAGAVPRPRGPCTDTHARRTWLDKKQACRLLTKQNARGQFK